MKNFKIGISSNFKYSKISLPRLLKSLLSSGVKSEDIDVFVGDSNKCESESIDDIKHYYILENSFDYTALVGIVRHKIEDSNYLILHDTCEVLQYFGPRFYKTIIPKYRDSNNNVRMCNQGFSNSMGIYTNKFFKDNYNLIDIYLGNRGKQFYIDNENVFFSKNSDFLNQASLSNYDFGYDVYGTGVLRYVELFPDIGLVKYKANHCKNTIIDI